MNQDRTSEKHANEIQLRIYYSLPNNGSFTGINSIHKRWSESILCAKIVVDYLINHPSSTEELKEILASLNEIKNTSKL